MGFRGCSMSDERRIPRAPAGLKAAGRRVWTSILGGIAEGYELDERELLVLEVAARQADQNRALEDALAEAGVVVRGSAGQPRLNAVATELRQGRIALDKLLGSIGLPDEDAGERLTERGRRAKHAADSRWAAHRQREARRGA